MATFYWYPKCSTCKKAKIWLDENNISYDMIDMIKEPPAKDLLITWMENNDYQFAVSSIQVEFVIENRD